jgi:hypothetical protein
MRFSASGWKSAGCNSTYSERGGSTGTLGHGCKRAIFALTAMPTRAFRRQISAVSHRRQHRDNARARQINTMVSL